MTLSPRGGRRTVFRWSMTVVALLGAVACTDDGGDGPDAAPPAASTTTTSTAGGGEPGGGEPRGLDFVAGSTVDLGDGWTIAPCESGPPLFCVRQGGETQATLELRSAPVASYESMKKTLDAGGSPMEAMRAEAAEFQSVFEKDRPEGCGAAYVVEPFGPDAATVAGKPGVVYGFDGRQAGRHVERSLQFLTIDGPTAHLITATAIDENTCMDDGELSEFTVAELTQLEPKLVRVVAASTLP